MNLISSRIKAYSFNSNGGKTNQLKDFSKPQVKYIKFEKKIQLPIWSRILKKL